MTRNELAVLIERMYPSFLVRNGKVYFPCYDLYEDLSAHIDDLQFFTHDEERSDPETVMVVRKPTYQIRRLPRLALLRFIERNALPYFTFRKNRGSQGINTEVVLGIKRCQQLLAVYDSSRELGTGKVSQ